MGGGASADRNAKAIKAVTTEEKRWLGNDRTLLTQRLVFTHDANEAGADGAAALQDKLKQQRATIVLDLRKTCFGKDEREMKMSMITLLTEQVATVGAPDKWEDEYKVVCADGKYKATCGGHDISLGDMFPLRQMLVVTPLTRDCRRKIFEAWASEKILCFRGPPGTGKLEVIRDTFLDLGMCPVALECPKTEDEIKATFEQWEGCPVMLDSVNKLDAELLGKLSEVCAGHRVCMTYDPDAEGANEVSEALLEKCVVQDLVKPDYKLILEVMFFGAGFLQGDKLAEAMMAAEKVTGLRDLKAAVDELTEKASADWVAVGSDEVTWATGKCAAM